MVKSIRIRIDGKEQDVDLKRLTVMLHQGDMNLEIVDPRVQEITPEDTLAMARHIPQELWVEWRDLKRFVAMWKSVWEDTPPPKVLAEANHAMRHTVGLFILVINGLLFWLAGSLIEGFVVSGFWPAVFGSVLYSVISWALSALLLSGKR